ncbi:uncharacterized protein LOC123509865 [Portunus trituberculatus]|uniref:uncharacterized protein LOC123509865 n=1 Tax=Portunus trituberculatus TaxID=210409 RepID=UPI001E1D1696|nr:uncharacterized protein LOC123509865 [Portunus trituberculatus]
MAKINTKTFNRAGDYVGQVYPRRLKKSCITIAYDMSTDPVWRAEVATMAAHSVDTATRYYAFKDSSAAGERVFTRLQQELKSTEPALQGSSETEEEDEACPEAVDDPARIESPLPYLAYDHNDQAASPNKAIRAGSPASGLAFSIVSGVQAMGPPPSPPSAPTGGQSKVLLPQRAASPASSGESSLVSGVQAMGPPPPPPSAPTGGQTKVLLPQRAASPASSGESSLVSGVQAMGPPPSPPSAPTEGQRKVLLPQRAVSPASSGELSLVSGPHPVSGQYSLKRSRSPVACVKGKRQRIKRNTACSVTVKTIDSVVGQRFNKILLNMNEIRKNTFRVNWKQAKIQYDRKYKHLHGINHKALRSMRTEDMDIHEDTLTSHLSKQRPCAYGLLQDTMRIPHPVAYTSPATNSRWQPATQEVKLRIANKSCRR